MHLSLLPQHWAYKLEPLSLPLNMYLLGMELRSSCLHTASALLTVSAAQLDPLFPTHLWKSEHAQVGSRALDLVLVVGLQDKDVFLALFTVAHVPLLWHFCGENFLPVFFLQFGPSVAPQGSAGK